MEELKTKYPYITDEQWSLVEVGNNTVDEFLNKEDKAVFRQAQKDGLKAAIKQAEAEEQAQDLLEFIDAAEEVFKAKHGRYFGDSDIEFHTKRGDLKGLKFTVEDSVTPEGEVGYRVLFKYEQEETKIKFLKSHAKGKGVEAHDWQDISEDEIK